MLCCDVILVPVSAMYCYGALCQVGVTEAEDANSAFFQLYQVNLPYLPS